ncbi:MAG: hypothetical protein LBE20_07735 [Deltaproteobacteria bacterium]|jgi:hypothetical protein|nr:hypothetical protein [Deltaproteobacteria bacterium]
MTAYVPGLIISPQIKIEKVRELSLPGKTLVKVGATVAYNTPTLSAQMPSEIYIVRIPDKTGIDTLQVKAGLLHKVGDSVQKGELIFKLKTCWGLWTTQLESPVSGVVEFFNTSTGHLGIRPPATTLQIPAYINGTVTEVGTDKFVKIEATVAMLQGIFGIGGERFGQILVLNIANNQVVTREYLSNLGVSLAGLVLIGGSSFDLSALDFALEQKAAGILTGSITSKVLRNFVGYNLGTAMTGDEKLGLTFIISEGFGELAISERVMKIAKTLQGQMASINGATQVRAGAMRPEVIVSSNLTKENQSFLSQAEQEQASATKLCSSETLTCGSPVRIIRTPYFGRFGVITELPAQLTKIESGAMVRVAKVLLQDENREVYIPRTNLEL